MQELSRTPFWGGSRAPAAEKSLLSPPRQGLLILLKRLNPHSSITLYQNPNKFFFLPDSPALSTCAAGTRREDRTSPSTDAHEQTLPFHTPYSTGSLCASYKCASQQAAHTAGVPKLLFLTQLPGNIRVTPTGINEEAHPTSFLHPTSVFVQKTTTNSPVNNHIFFVGVPGRPNVPESSCPRNSLLDLHGKITPTTFSTHNAGCGKNHLLHLKTTLETCKEKPCRQESRAKNCNAAHAGLRVKRFLSVFHTMSQGLQTFLEDQCNLLFVLRYGACQKGSQSVPCDVSQNILPG